MHLCANARQYAVRALGYSADNVDALKIAFNAVRLLSAARLVQTTRWGTPFAATTYEPVSV